MRYLVLSLFIFSSQGFAARSVEVHGHRGARGYYPENTLPAFAHALKVGVDVIELDMGVTKDEKVIISHDPSINPLRCLNKNGQEITTEIILKNITLKEAKEFDCGSLKNPDFPKQVQIPKTPMPTLDEFFLFIKNSEDPNAKTIRFNIETKIDPSKPDHFVTPEKFAKLVYDIVKKHRMEKRVIIQSFDPRTLVEIKKLNSSLVTAILLAEEPTALLKMVKELKVDIVSPYFKWIKEKHVMDLKKENIPVIPWTANKNDDWKVLTKIGVAGIITDYPDDLIKYLNPLP